MSTIRKDIKFKLDGKTSFKIGSDQQKWFDGWLGYLDIWSGDDGKKITASATLSGQKWSMSTVRFSGDAKLKVDIKDQATSKTLIGTIQLGSDKSAGSSLMLKNTSVDFLVGGGSIDKVTLGAGNHGSVDLRNGNDSVVTGKGWVGSLLTGSGNDAVTMGNGNAGSISLGNGADNIKLGSGGVDSLTTGAGKDVVTGGKGRVTLVDTGADNDIVRVNGGTMDVIHLGAGNNSVTVNDGSVRSIIAFDGSDTVKIVKSKFVGTINVAGGANKVETGSGYVDAVISYGGADRVTGGAGGGGVINVGGGNNIVTTTGKFGAILAYDGNDKVTLSSGGAGTVSLSGGNDTVVLNPLKIADDVVTLSGGKGIDSVSFASFTTSVSIALGLENITSKGTFVLSGFETLIGGKGNDTLAGDKQANTLTGGAGADSFVFNTALGNVAVGKSANVDSITDFGQTPPNSDLVKLDNAIFTALGAATGALNIGFFAANATGTAVDADDFIVYQTGTGKLFYDADGVGAGAAVQFALLTSKPTLLSDDFMVI